MGDAKNAKFVVMTQEEVRRLHDSSSQIQGYEYVYDYELNEEEKLSMEEVEDRVKRCSCKTREECLQDPELRRFAERTHPKIFEAVMSKDPKRLKILRQMIATNKRIARRPETEEKELKNLQAKILKASMRR